MTLCGQGSIYFFVLVKLHRLCLAEPSLTLHYIMKIRMRNASRIPRDAQPRPLVPVPTCGKKLSFMSMVRVRRWVGPSSVASSRLAPYHGYCFPSASLTIVYLPLAISGNSQLVLEERGNVCVCVCVCVCEWVEGGCVCVSGWTSCVSCASRWRSQQLPTRPEIKRVCVRVCACVCLFVHLVSSACRECDSIHSQ